MKNFQRTLFIFRRDLRLEDNTGLIHALKTSQEVISAFIFTPEQIENNPYRSDHSLKFMLESLADLARQLEEKGSRLVLFQGEAEEVVEKCIEKLHIDALIINKDYTPYSVDRDKKLEMVCKKHKVLFDAFDDALLHLPEESLKKDGKPYTVFTPFFRNASKKPVMAPVHNSASNYYRNEISFAKDSKFISKMISQIDVDNVLLGGRKEAVKILRGLSKYSDYERQRNFPAQDYSTHLSPYLKFNVCSIREVYEAIYQQLGESHELIRALYWRDFFTCIAFYFPHVFGEVFHRRFNHLKWSNDREAFKRWCEGKTGFPIVDAGMRELNETGIMHNRVRMITASFLVKDLHIDWRWGEKYFAQHLIDYDPAVNNGNWQWVASTGCDAQPYFRIFNPWNQQKKFDPDGIYIKHWVKELSSSSSMMIHNWFNPKYYEQALEYPSPMIDHSEESKKALEKFKAL